MPGPGVGTGLAPPFSACAFAFVRRNTPDSKATSSVPMSSPNQTRSYEPSDFWPDANPKSPRLTNSTILPRRIVSGSRRRVSEPLVERGPGLGRK